MEPGHEDREDSSRILPRLVNDFTRSRERCHRNEHPDRANLVANHRKTPPYRAFERSPGKRPASERSLNNLGLLRGQPCAPTDECEAVLPDLAEVDDHDRVLVEVHDLLTVSP